MKCWDKDILDKTVSRSAPSVEWAIRAVMVMVMRCPTVLLLLLCLQPGPAVADFEKTCNLEDRREGPAAGGICGSRLPEVIRLTCLVRRHRRSAKSLKGKAIDKQSELKDLTLHKSTALSYLLKRSNGLGEQGITCECCYNRCSLTELMQYC
ncbi:con-Ins Im2-like [Haliotis rufescens]|uniref:con-Ins Im2-like n=1 Tax=Haliotis rufescens TaxID=6454 RepID=UPI00201EE0BA|nr:con-Ins Im2-like [Haliotis rufescens]